MDQPQPGWHPDPSMPGTERFWDGSAWSDNVRPSASAQQPAMPYGAPPTKPNNMMVWAILTTIFCCLPFGVVSIVHAMQVDSRWNDGDYVGAQKSADTAQKWAIASAASSAVILLLYLLLIVLTLGAPA